MWIIKWFFIISYKYRLPISTNLVYSISTSIHFIWLLCTSTHSFLLCTILISFSLTRTNYWLFTKYYKCSFKKRYFCHLCFNVSNCCPQTSCIIAHSRFYSLQSLGSGEPLGNNDCKGSPECSFDSRQGTLVWQELIFCFS